MSRDPIARWRTVLRRGLLAARGSGCRLMSLGVTGLWGRASSAPPVCCLRPQMPDLVDRVIGFRSVNMYYTVQFTILGESACRSDDGRCAHRPAWRQGGSARA